MLRMVNMSFTTIEDKGLLVKLLNLLAYSALEVSD